MTVPVPDTGDPVVIAAGVSVVDVLALAPHAAVRDDRDNRVRNLGNVEFTDTTRKAVFWSQVEQFIRDVAARTGGIAARVSALADEPSRVALTGSIRDAVVNGAASYLVAASFAAQASTNNNTSYSQVLWDRYQSGVALVEASLTELTTPGAVGAVGGVVSGEFPEPMFPDGGVW